MSNEPEISEWGNPAQVMLCHPMMNKIVIEKVTQGTETSKYLEEKKENRFPKQRRAKGEEPKPT